MKGDIWEDPEACRCLEEGCWVQDVHTWLLRETPLEVTGAARSPAWPPCGEALWWGSLCKTYVLGERHGLGIWVLSDSVLGSQWKVLGESVGIWGFILTCSGDSSGVLVERIE